MRARLTMPLQVGLAYCSRMVRRIRLPARVNSRLYVVGENSNSATVCGSRTTYDAPVSTRVHSLLRRHLLHRFFCLIELFFRYYSLISQWGNYRWRLVRPRLFSAFSSSSACFWVRRLNHLYCPQLPVLAICI
jgi:hypothetical protein